MADQDLDRSEEATPHKLQKARDEAQTPRSPDAVAAAVFLAATFFLAWQGAETIQALLRLFRAGLVQAGQLGPDAVRLWPLVVELGTRSVGALLPLLLALPLAGALAAGAWEAGAA